MKINDRFKVWGDLDQEDAEWLEQMALLTGVNEEELVRLACQFFFNRHENHKTTNELHRKRFQLRFF